MSEQKLFVLVVEDDEVDRTIVSRAVKASGMNIELSFAGDIEGGKEKTKDKSYDCIFLDYNLPGGSGLDLLEYIRSVGNTSPVIIVTSHGDEKLAVAAMKLGASDYIPKNLLSADGIAQSLRYVFKMKEAEREKTRIEKELRETQLRMQTVAANSPIVLFMLDEHATYTLFEGKGIEEFGIEKKQFAGTTIDESGKYFPISKEKYSEALNGTECSNTIELDDKFLEITLAPIKNENGKITGVIGVASNVTVHKEAERELMNAKTIAEDTAKLKQNFLANMSHEIRTPMNGIIGLTGILLKTKMDDEQMHYLKSIKTCSDNLWVIINDILDISKVESGKMTFEKTDFKIADIAQHTFELFNTKAIEKNIDLKINFDKNIPSIVKGDPTRLSQIMSNLLSNAIKFTTKGGVALDIKLRSEREENITVDFAVKDSGIGIPESSIISIFESFTQASTDTTRKFGGTGLGLTIVKRLIELQGGTIGVKSKPGEGTTFSFHLTFERGEEINKIEDTSATDAIDISHLNILIAEDNMVNQMIVKKVITDWGAKVEFADNGKIAVDKVQQDNYDIILMDIQMPVMDGYTATNIIRALGEPFRNIPIMAMTASVSATEKEVVCSKGMTDYISKPFNPAELKSKLLELTKNNIRSSANKNTGAENIAVEKTATEITETTSAKIQTEVETSNAVTSSHNMKIDLTYIKQIAGGNDAFIIEMIETFLNNTPDALEKMNESFKQKNWEELRQIAHRIKPSYIYVGLKELNKKLQEIENCSFTKTNLETLPALLEEVGTQSNSAFRDLKDELKGMK